MKFLNLYIALIIVFILTSCFKDPATGPVDGRAGAIDTIVSNDSIVDVIKPLAIGNSWTYVYSYKSIIRPFDTVYSALSTDELFTEKIDKDTIFHNNRWFSTSYMSTSISGNSLYYLNYLMQNKFQANLSDGLYMQNNIDTTFSNLKDQPAYHFLPSPNVYGYYKYADILDINGTMRYYSGSEAEVKTVAGTFKNCLHFQDIPAYDSLNPTSFAFYDTYYAKGVGLVLVEKTTFSNTKDMLPIIIHRVELYDYKAVAQTKKVK